MLVPDRTSVGVAVLLPRPTAQHWARGDTESEADVTPWFLGSPGVPDPQAGQGERTTSIPLLQFSFLRLYAFQIFWMGPYSEMIQQLTGNIVQVPREGKM